MSLFSFSHPIFPTHIVSTTLFLLHSRHSSVLHPTVLSVDIYVDVEVEQEEKEEWAKPLTQLWQCRPYNPQAEREYNKSMGQQAPYCSICLLFHTYHQVIPTSILCFYDVSSVIGVLITVLLYNEWKVVVISIS